MTKINLKVTKIHPELDEVRRLFNSRISSKLGVDDFPKNKSDVILANAIKSSFMDFDIQMKKAGKKLEAFDIKWR